MCLIDSPESAVRKNRKHASCWPLTLEAMFGAIHSIPPKLLKLKRALTWALESLFMMGELPIQLDLLQLLKTKHLLIKLVGFVYCSSVLSCLTEEERNVQHKLLVCVIFGVCLCFFMHAFDVNEMTVNNALCYWRHWQKKKTTTSFPRVSPCKLGGARKALGTRFALKTDNNQKTKLQTKKYEQSLGVSKVNFLYSMLLSGT